MSRELDPAGGARRAGDPAGAGGGAGTGAENARAPLPVDPNHPAFAGHFPDFPVLPGAVLLDEALRAIERGRGLDLTHWRVASAKFLRLVRPGEVLILEHTAEGHDSIRFTILTAEFTVASGLLSHGG